MPSLYVIMLSQYDSTESLWTVIVTQRRMLWLRQSFKGQRDDFNIGLLLYFQDLRVTTSKHAARHPTPLPSTSQQ